MHTITIHGVGPVRIADGEPLSVALQRAGVSASMPCGGRGTCGKCAVWLQGPAEPPTAAEQALRQQLPEEVPPGPGYVLRLACYTCVQGDCMLMLPGEKADVVTEGGGALPDYDGTRPDALGIAIDIGTTTLALRLYDLPGKALLASRSALNQQTAFGADVLTRIAYANAHGHETLSRPLRMQLIGMIEAVLAQAGLPSGRVEHIVITGNTTMLHFAAGLDPQGIGIAPFTPESLFGEEHPARAFFPSLPAHALLYFPRCVSAYVGADVTCGMLAGNLLTRPGCRLLVDVGTNGEMALLMDGTILCCATAAGPAFEGAHIRMGMGAAKGGISRVWLADGHVQYETIGGAAPRGICGTGLIGAIGVMLEMGVLDATGAMADDIDGEQGFQLGDSGIFLTARDIREVQLAKAAIAAGVETLLHAGGKSPRDVDALLLAGGFGTRLNPVEAAAIGLIPASLVTAAQGSGNLALAGASAMLFAQEARRQAETAARAAREVSLATEAFFMEKYMEQMMFPEE